MKTRNLDYGMVGIAIIIATAVLVFFGLIAFAIHEDDLTNSWMAKNHCRPTSQQRDDSYYTYMHVGSSTIPVYNEDVATFYICDNNQGIWR